MYLGACGHRATKTRNPFFYPIYRPSHKITFSKRQSSPRQPLRWPPATFSSSIIESLSSQLFMFIIPRSLYQSPVYFSRGVPVFFFFVSFFHATQRCIFPVKRGYGRFRASGFIRRRFGKGESCISLPVIPVHTKGVFERERERERWHEAPS
ncbi:hypothetical protein F4820DRAFT_149673 [Hypoxylon rubiginosum]|uniref:Uncharacterized protein n=1 Tax=Hypoxylon rubiginosum TaxID=110542 RepID=A0ACB9ZHK0_9PEZI|nr:hypothetical protein F4820DRAFT_149673 [Hypoxylon rubiginosum]